MITVDSAPKPLRSLEDANAEIGLLHDRIAQLERDLASARGGGDVPPLPIADAPTPHTAAPVPTPEAPPSDATPLLDAQASQLATLEQFAQQIEAVRSFWKETARGGTVTRLPTGGPRAPVDDVLGGSDEAANRKLDELRLAIHKLREERAQASAQLMQLARSGPEPIGDDGLPIERPAPPPTGHVPDAASPVIVEAAASSADDPARAPVVDSGTGPKQPPATAAPPALRIVPPPGSRPEPVLEPDVDTTSVAALPAEPLPEPEPDFLAEADAALTSAEQVVEKARQVERESVADAEGDDVATDATPEASPSFDTEPSQRRGISVPVLAVVLAGVLAGGAWWWSSTQRTPVAAPMPGPTQPTAPAATATPAPATAEPTTPEPVAPPPVDEPPPSTTPVPAGAHRVQLTVLRDVWLDVIADGNRAQRGIFTAGETLDVDVRGSLQVRAGDAGAVRVTVDGEGRGTLGVDGAVTTRTYDLTGPGGR